MEVRPPTDWAKHAHVNCFDGRGAVAIGDIQVPLSESTSLSSQEDVAVSTCQQHCLSVPACRAFVMPATGKAGGRVAACHLRKDVSLDACVHDRRFHLFVRNLSTAPLPSCTDMLLPTLNFQRASDRAGARVHRRRRCVRVTPRQRRRGELFIVHDPGRFSPVDHLMQN